MPKKNVKPSNCGEVLTEPNVRYLMRYGRWVRVQETPWQPLEKARKCDAAELVDRRKRGRPRLWTGKAWAKLFNAINEINHARKKGVLDAARIARQRDPELKRCSARSLVNSYYEFRKIYRLVIVGATLDIYSNKQHPPMGYIVSWVR